MCPCTEGLVRTLMEGEVVTLVAFAERASDSATTRHELLLMVPQLPIEDRSEALRIANAARPSTATGGPVMPDGAPIPPPQRRNAAPGARRAPQHRRPERRSTRAAGRHAATPGRSKATAGKSSSTGDDGPGEPPLAVAAELEGLRSEIEQLKADWASCTLRIAQEFKELRACDMDALDERLSLRTAVLKTMDGQVALHALVMALLRAYGKPEGGAE